MKLEEHPTVLAARAASTIAATPLDSAELKRICMEAGVDDMGVVEVTRPGLAETPDDFNSILPRAKSVISFVVRMNRDPIRSSARSIANLEFHHVGDVVNETAHAIVAALAERGVRAVNPAMGFPMEMQKFPGKVWTVSHKPIAVQAGLGQIGIHRNVIHPKFGNFILLGSVVLDREVAQYDQPIHYNPCLECKLCAAACPVGAVGINGSFDFSACYTHNYREFMGGFTDWIGDVADSKNAKDYNSKVNESESASWWQSLSFGANYKAAYCMAVCPAGEDVIAPFLEDRKSFQDTGLKPLREKEEPVYVLKDSDAEAYASKRFPNKTIRQVGNSLKPTSIGGFLNGMPLTFQKTQAKDLNACYHFVFTGAEPSEATVEIRDGTIKVSEGLINEPDLRITADSETWVGFLRGQKNLAWALMTRRVKLKGKIKLLVEFGRCFPD